MTDAIGFRVRFRTGTEMKQLKIMIVIGLYSQSREHFGWFYPTSIFDYAEKDLLSRHFRQPELVCFITGIKLDIFGFLNFKSRKIAVMSLPGGNFPNEKNADCVLLMLYLSITKILEGTHSEILSSHF